MVVLILETGGSMIMDDELLVVIGGGVVDEDDGIVEFPTDGSSMIVDELLLVVKIGGSVEEDTDVLDEEGSTVVEEADIDTEGVVIGLGCVTGIVLDGSVDGVSTGVVISDEDSGTVVDEIVMDGS